MTQSVAEGKKVMTPGADSRIKNNSSHFTFNGTFDNLTPTQKQLNQQDYKTLDMLKKNEQMHAMNILQNFQKLIQSQAFMPQSGPLKEKIMKFCQSQIEINN